MNPLKLAANQRNIWQDQQYYPNSPVYNIGGAYTFHGHIDKNLLQKSLTQMVNEQDSYRMAVNSASPNHLTYLPSLSINLDIIDVSNNDNPMHAAEQWVKSSFKIPFSLDNNTSLLQFTLLKAQKDRYYLLTKYHHVIADGWGTTIILERFSAIYNALFNNVEIPKNTMVTYADFLAQEQQYLHSKSYQADKQFWFQHLPTLPSSLITRRYPITSNNSLARSNVHRFPISTDFYAKINAFSKENQHTSYHVFLSAFAIYFSRIYQRDDILLGVPSLNRNGAKYKDVFGMFISLSVLKLTLDKSDTTHTIIQNVKEGLKELYRHRRFPLEDINKRLKLLQNGRDTLFDIIFSYEKFEYTAKLGDTEVSAKQQFSGISRYPLAITLCEFSHSQNNVEVILEGAETCFTPIDLKSLEQHILLILEQLIEPPIALHKINILTKQETQQLFENEPPTPNNKTKPPSVLELFQQQCTHNPTKIAVEYKAYRLSYHQLDNASNQLAQIILATPLLKNKIIALYFSRNIEMIIAILACFKINAAYLPLATDIPDDRIKYILQQSRADLVLTEHAYLPRIHLITPHVIRVNKDNKETFPVLNYKTKSSDLAYIIFTSGSTGKPKGVIIDHAALSLRLQWLQKLFNLETNDRMGQSIPYNFDPSLIEILLPLTQGATLVLIPENHYTIEYFAAYIIQHNISALAMVPSSIRMLLDGLQGQKSPLPLRIVCSGGERLEPNLAKQFLQQTSAHLFNVYGPTEATIISTIWQCDKYFSGLSLPIGQAADHTQIYILDAQLNPLPINTVGEICIAGPTLAKSYINQEVLSTQSFPIWKYTNERIYRTGDLGYRGHDGLLYFSGRNDRQIKISGYRIELSEIESVLQQHSGVTLSAVITIQENQQINIYAYVETPHNEPDILIKALSLLLREHLPAYMQPRKIIVLNTLPISQTGKIDYHALPLPNYKNSHHKKTSARNPLEKTLLTTWHNILSINEISVFDNFFELGGDSLSASNLMIALEEQTHIRYPLSFLLKHPTIAEQALALQNTQNTDNQLQILNTLSQHSDAIDIFIAASGHGDMLRLTALADILGNSYNIHILQVLTKDKNFSIHDIAQRYAEQIINLHSQAPFYLAGFSVGGITALETTLILKANNKIPQSVILLDSIYPRWPLQSPLLFKLLQYSVKLLHLDNKKVNNRKLSAMLNDPGINTQLAALPKHKIQSFDLPIHLILTQNMWMFHPLLFSSWVRLFKHNLTHHTVSGLHGEMFQYPHIQLLSKTIKKITKI